MPSHGLEFQTAILGVRSEHKIAFTIRGALMLRLISAAVTFFITCQLAHAQWTTKVEDDVLTDGKSAVMAGLVSLSQAIYLDCSSDGKLSLSYIEKSDWDDILKNAPAKMAIKVGDGEKVWLDVI